MREPNILLDAIIDESGMSHDGLAARINQLGAREGLGLLYDHASVRRWIRDGTVPRGKVPELICEVLSMSLGRSVLLADIGMDRGAAGGQADGDRQLAQAVDHAVALWRSDFKQAVALRPAELIRGPAAIVPVFEWETRRTTSISHGTGRAGSKPGRCASCGAPGRVTSACTGRRGESRYDRVS